MTPKETRELNKHLEAAAAILFKNTPPEKLQDFESLELSLEAVWKGSAEVIKATWAILRIAQTLILSWEICCIRGIKKR